MLDLLADHAAARRNRSFGCCGRLIPDGVANERRGNGNGVDLNRNFPHDWTQIGQPGAGQYSGSGPASEPETQAFIVLTERIRPTLTLWYHQTFIEFLRQPTATPAATALRRADRPPR